MMKSCENKMESIHGLCLKSCLPKLRNIKAFLIDLDGTTYIGKKIIPGAKIFINSLSCKNIPYIFITNNSSESRKRYAEKLNSFGLCASEENIMTSTYATAMYLKEKQHNTVFCIGTPSFEDELRSFDITLSTNAPCVVLSFDKTLSYEKLATACKLIDNGACFIATNPDIVCLTEEGNIPDCGSMIALLKTATGKSPFIVGKPHNEMLRLCIQKLNIPKETIALIGDRIYTDIKMGKEGGLMTILTLTGESTINDIHNSSILPDLYVDSLEYLHTEWLQPMLTKQKVHE